MNEIPSILTLKEKLIWDGVPKYAPYISASVLIGLFVGLFAGIWAGGFFTSTFLGLVFGGVIAFAGYYIGHLSYTFVHYALTDKRVVIQTGIFGRNFKCRISNFKSISKS
jgi:uncharacterized membrane protein YdbT with pleckstrin-like domain